MRTWWNKVPFLRLVIPLVMGIAMSGVPAGVMIPLFSAGMAAFLAPAFLSLRWGFYVRWLPGWGLHILIFCLGFSVCRWQDHRLDPGWFGHQEAALLVVKTVGQSRSFSGERSGWVTDAQVLAVKEPGAFRAGEAPLENTGGWKTVTGKLRLTVAGFDELPENTVLMIRGQPKKINPRSPGAVSMANRNIYHRIHTDQSRMRLLAPGKRDNRIIERIRNKILHLLEGRFEKQAQRSLSQALLVGHREGLDDALNLAYANTGVIHVIAISGMHLGLIYGLLVTVFRPIRKRATGRVFSNLLIMGFLWIFTLLCGASASVTRSALMFSSLLVAECVGQENTAANALASSAFIMLCLHPMVLYDIGFQLSYAAVASLMLFNSRVRRIFDPENPLLVQVWNLVATSCAAQILTTPLVLQHFGRFPVLFIPANLIAIPLSGLVLVLLILVCISHPVDFVAAPLASCTGSLMDIMNDRIVDMARIPFASLVLDWSTRDTVFAYITIFIICWFAMAKRNPRA